MCSPSTFKIRDAILNLGRIHDPALDWCGMGNFRFANPIRATQDSDTSMFGIKVDSRLSGHFSVDARIIVRNAIGNMFTEDGAYRAFNMNLDWHGSVPLATHQPESCFVQLKYHQYDEVISCADLYCGGFGGWQHAAEFLATNFDIPFRYLWAIDRDSTATRCHCQNFGGTLISEESVEHFTLPQNEKLVICGGCDYVFLNRVNLQVPTKGASASFPCPPWSRGSKGKGFDYQDGGLAILEILRAGIVNNWEFILLENVDAIIEHFHFSWIRTYIDDAGYYIAFSNVSCIGEITAAKRRRWICVILQKHIRCRIPQKAFDWSMPFAPTLKSCKILPSKLPEQHEKDLTLDEDLLGIYGSPAFAPLSMKCRFTIEKRIKHGYEQMSTTTATYGRQHELPEDIICTEMQSQGKGIYSDLVLGKFGPRFWSPVEIAMTMIIFKRTYFPLLPSDALRLTGNAISTMHAMKGIYALCAGVGAKTIPSFEDVFHFALQKRIHMENCCIFIWNDWVVVEHKVFDIKDIEISLTLPMPRSIVIRMWNESKTIELPHQCTVADVLTLLELTTEDVFVSWKPAHIRARSIDQVISNDTEEIFITEKFRVQAHISPIDVPFANECIRQLKSCISSVRVSDEPVFFPVQVYQDDRPCIVVHVWTGVKVQNFAEACWRAGTIATGELSCIRLVPPLNDDQSNVGWWGLKGNGSCEIFVIAKKQREFQAYSLMVWDESRKSPLLGMRVGEASHPGPTTTSTLEFKFGSCNRCVKRSNINTKTSVFEIAASLGVSVSESFLWDPISRKEIDWDHVEAVTSCYCYVKPIGWKPPMKMEYEVSFWDFLPTKLPNMKQCKINRNVDFSFGIIHRMTEIELFNAQFEQIIFEMNSNFAKASNHVMHSPLPCVANCEAKDLVYVAPNQPHDGTEDVTSVESNAEKSPEKHETREKEPNQTAGKNRRRCQKTAVHHPEFWVHLPIGRHFAAVSSTGCLTIADLVSKAFEQVNIPNWEYIVSGCYCTVNSRVCDFMMPIESISGSCIRVCLRGLQGGGKEDIQRACSAKLGEILIHKGLPINAVASKVQKIIEKLGLSQVHQALQNQSEIHAWKQIEQIAQSTDFVIFNDKEKKSLSATLIQRAVKKKKKGVVNSSAISVDQFTLPKGIFINEDGTETSTISIDKLRVGAHGIILTTEEKILPWIQNGIKSSADELGVIFLGNPTSNIEGTYQPSPLCFAAVNHEGKECILRGTLLQLGGKKVSLNRHFKVEGPQAAMTTCSLTAYASDFEAESFATLIKSPAKYMLAQLPDEAIRNSISSVWGRSFMKDGKRVPNLEADSVQIHISIKTDNVVELLKSSGICNIYITPKMESGLFDPKYHLIWTDLSKIAIEQKANEIQSHLGYIKGRKGFALRFLTSDAPDGFKILFPGKTFEKPVAINALYRLQPVPFGILPDVLTEACKAIKWNIKPIKRSGNSWLVGAEKQSPNKFLIIDGTTILVKEVEKTNNGNSPICLAGPKPKLTTKDRGFDPFTANDPWASFKPTNAMSSQHGATLQPTNHLASQASSNVGARSVTGPVEDRFKSQETRIHKLEQKLDDTMQHVKLLQSETQQEFQKHQKEIVDMRESFKSELIGLQKGITVSFQDSLKQAMQQQAQDMKKMFLESPTGESPFKKQPRLEDPAL